MSLLNESRPDVVFNLCEAPLGRPALEPNIAALFEWLGVPFTGSGSETLALCRRKDRTRAVLAAACALFPIQQDHQDHWYVRQKGFQRERWDLACLDPRQCAVPAAESLRRPCNPRSPSTGSGGGSSWAQTRLGRDIGGGPIPWRRDCLHDG